MSRFQSSLFLYLFFFAVNGCTNETEPKILPLDEGYKPDHKIDFSHELHAQIDCKYCHNSATDVKREGIPATNVCMKCHKEVKKEESAD